MSLTSHVHSLPFELRKMIFDTYRLGLTDPRDLTLAYLHEPHLRPQPKKAFLPCTFHENDVRMSQTTPFGWVYNLHDGDKEHSIVESKSGGMVHYFGKAAWGRDYVWEECENCKRHKRVIWKWN